MKTKKQTRKQEMKANLKAASEYRQFAQAQQIIVQALYKAYREAVFQYYGSQIPAELEKSLADKLQLAIQEAGSQGKDIDLQPIVTKVVSAYKNPAPVAVPDATGEVS